MAVGILYCVATPIGNLEDITARALRILAEVSKVYAEDTRVTRRMFTHFGIQNTLESLHDHNETSRVAQIQRELAEGVNVALVSDEVFTTFTLMGAVRWVAHEAVSSRMAVAGMMILFIDDRFLVVTESGWVQPMVK